MSRLLEKSIEMADNVLSKYDHWKTECTLNFMDVDTFYLVVIFVTIPNLTRLE